MTTTVLGKMLSLNRPYFVKYVQINHQRTFITSDTLNKIGDKVKGTIFENWLKFWKNLFIDYREMLRDVRSDAKQKPVKTAFLLTSFAVLGGCAKCNPDKNSFRAKYIECANKLILVHPPSQNPQAVKHLRYLETCFNRNLIRRLNLVVASVIWIDHSSDECNTYESQCPYLGIRYTDFTDRIVDFGFLNIWWNISKNMLDYDVNF